MKDLEAKVIKSEVDNQPNHLKGLRYPKFSIVFMQIFGLAECRTDKFDKKIVGTVEEVAQDDPNSITGIKRMAIDKLIFSYDKDGEPPVKRFTMPNFNISIELPAEEEKKKKGDTTPPKILYPAVTIEGKVHVDMSLFFDKTVVLTFSLLVDSDEEDVNSCIMSGGVVNTDQLISLVSLSLAGEHWSRDEEDDVAVTANTINLNPSPLKIWNLKIDENGERVEKGKEISLDTKTKKDFNPFEYLCDCYRKAITKKQKVFGNKHQDFVFVDVWEDIDNFDGSLQAMPKEEDMVSYIYEERKKELVGLMTLYPKEWPYRTEESYKDVCGSNIAIDTDDLIILNSAMCVVFGTYGRRAAGSPTDWGDHLEIRKSHFVSWPEYMLILEMILAKKYTIATAREYLLSSISKGKGISSVARKAMESNAAIELEITHLLLKLDAVNYSKFMSHKIMFDRTIKRLEIEKDEENLRQIMDKVEKSLSTISEMKSLKQAELFNFILGAITIASLFEVIFSELEIPLVRDYIQNGWQNTPGEFLVSISIFMAGIGLAYISGVIVKKVFLFLFKVGKLSCRLFMRLIRSIIGLLKTKK